MQMDHLIPAGTLDRVLINKKKKKKRKNLLSSGFCHSWRPQSENKRKQKDRQILEPCQRIKKAVKHKGDHNKSWCTWK